MQKIVTIFLLLISYCTLLSAADNQGNGTIHPPFALTPSDFQRALTVRYQYSNKIVNFVDTPPFWLRPRPLPTDGRHMVSASSLNSISKLGRSNRLSIIAALPKH